MALHLAIQQVIAKFKAQELHAARSGREVMDALTQAALNSETTSTGALAAEIDAACEKRLLDGLPAMVQLRSPNNRFPVFKRGHQRNASVLTTGINLEPDGLSLTTSPIDQEDGKGETP
jgi:hypothetical protein